MEEFDFGEHRFKAPIMCRIKLRPTHRGLDLRSDLEGLNGMVIPLKVLWLVEDDDSTYLGEWALGSANRQVSGIGGYPLSWIASGDVEVIDSK